MLFDVTAMCVDVETGEQIAPPRVEQIDTYTNELFSEADCAADVEDRYHTFWNRLNGFTNTYPHGKVIVLKVEAA